MRWAFALFLSFFLSGQAIAAESKCRVLLVPGAFGEHQSGRFLKPEDYFREYRDFLESKGCVVKKAYFPPNGTIEERGRMLRDQAEKFDRENPGDPLILIAHSQGGLDARFALKRLKLPDVRALVTIGTPNLGARAAQWAVEQRNRGTWLYWVVRVVSGYDLRRLPFLQQMTPEFLSLHPYLFEKVPGVRYLSGVAACRTKCHWALRLLSLWVGLGSGDGLIEASSQEYGEVIGEFDLDHISSVGADDPKRAERHRWLEAMWSALNENASDQ